MIGDFDHSQYKNDLAVSGLQMDIKLNFSRNKANEIVSTVSLANVQMNASAKLCVRKGVVTASLLGIDDFVGSNGSLKLIKAKDGFTATGQLAGRDVRETFTQQ